MYSHSIKTALKVEVYDKYGKIKNSIYTETPNPTADNILIKKFDSYGNQLQQINMPFQSWNINFLSNVYTFLYYGGTDNAGTFYDLNNSSFGGRGGYELSGSVGDLNYGIVAGTGSIAMSNITSSKMLGLISNGTTSGTLQYSVAYVASESVSNTSGGYSMRLYRHLYNAHASDITITETGLYTGISILSAVERAAMLARDTKDYNGSNISITISNTQTAEINYYVGFDSSSILNRNFINTLIKYAGKGGTYNTGVVSTTGANLNLTTNQFGAELRLATATDGVYSHGILIGTSSQVISPTDYNLYGICNEGTVHYNATQMSSFNNDGTSSCNFYAYRTISNTSTASLNITEIALVGYGQNTATSRVMFGRALTGGSGVNLEVSESANFTFIFSSSLN